MTASSREISLLLLTTLACGGCGGEAPAPRVMLADVDAATLVEAPAPRSPEALLAEDFADTEGWRAIDDPARPFDETSALQVTLGVDQDQGFVRLAGTRGALFRVVEVAPSTPYRFEAVLRTSGVVPGETGAGGAFFGARPWVAELTRFGPADELLAADVERLISRRILFPTSAGLEDWHERRRVFRTGPETRALLVACTLGLSETVRAGSVDFREVRVEPVPARVLRLDLLEAARHEFARGEPTPTGWRAKRRVIAELGAETRPGVVLLPGERLTFRRRLSSGTPRFEAGLGAWRPALADALTSGEPTATTLVVSVDGAEVLRRELAAPETLVDARWTDVEVDLARWAGEEVALELAVEGALPGVFGAPALYDAEFVADRPNLVLVSIDTLRADRLGSYGYPEDVSPHLDRFAAESVRFANTFSQAPYTLPSHTTMFSGQFPSVHGIQTAGQVISTERSPLLARVLSERGYRTLALTGGGYLNPDFGFHKGFDAFLTIDPLRHRDSNYLAQLVREDPQRFSQELIAENGIDRAHRFLERNRDHPFFLFLHTYTVHDYDPPAGHQRCEQRGCPSDRTDWRQFRLTPVEGWNPSPATELDRAHLSHRYDDALSYVDELLGGVLAKLDALGLTENTIVAVTTDHGEEMLERGFVQHGKTLYEEVTRIPLLLRVPGVDARVVEAPAMTVDLVPTLFAHMGLPRDERMQGVDLLADELGERPTWSEIHDSFVHKYTLRDGEWKLIHNPPDDVVVFPSKVEWELYDLARDAAELQNLSAEERARFERMRTLLETHRDALQALGESLGAVGIGEVDEETLIQLRELGYL